jgi:hypothetical protein
MKNFNDVSFTILLLFIIMTILLFFRTILYILFDENFLNLDSKYFKKSNKEDIDYIITFFAVIRVFLCFAIIYLLNFKLQNNILSYSLLYLILSGFIRFYYQYMISYYPNSKIIKPIDRFQDVNAVLLFFVSLYVITKIFYY